MGFDLAGRTALVTGASRGIGRELVRELLRRGVSRIVAVARDEAALARLVGDHPGQVEGVEADLADPAQVRALIERVAAIAPDLSLLINNAGAQRLSNFVGEPFADAWPQLEREIHLNFNAAIMLSGGLLPLLASRPDAAIVHVTTGLVLAPKASAPVYCAAKAGLSAFSRSLRYQCEAAAPHVRVVEALPPIVDTEMTRGRGRGKISAAECARQIVAGLSRGRDTIDVGKTGLLRAIMRISPALGYRVMRHG